MGSSFKRKLFLCLASALIDHFIQGYVSKEVRLKCPKEDKPLKDILTMARTQETACGETCQSNGTGIQ